MRCVSNKVQENVRFVPQRAATKESPRFFVSFHFNSFRLEQVSIPVATVDGCPVGMGLIGPFGWDEELSALAVKVTTLVEASNL